MICIYLFFIFYFFFALACVRACVCVAVYLDYIGRWLLIGFLVGFFFFSLHLHERMQGQEGGSE